MADNIDQDEYGNMVGDEVEISIQFKDGKYEGKAFITKIRPSLVVQFKQSGKVKHIVISNSEIKRQ